VRKPITKAVTAPDGERDFLRKPCTLRRMARESGRRLIGAKTYLVLVLNMTAVCLAAPLISNKIFLGKFHFRREELVEKVQRKL
jgi:hypothetical protein